MKRGWVNKHSEWLTTISRLQPKKTMCGLQWGCDLCDRLAFLWYLSSNTEEPLSFFRRSFIHPHWQIFSLSPSVLVLERTLDSLWAFISEKTQTPTLGIDPNELLLRLVKSNSVQRPSALRICTTAQTTPGCSCCGLRGVLYVRVYVGV